LPDVFSARAVALIGFRGNEHEMRVFIVVAILTLSISARAETGVAPEPGVDAEPAGIAVHAGLNVRADSGAHAFRVIAGFDTGSLDVSVTLDPMVVFDGQFDADLLLTRRLSRGGWGAVVGWRTTAIGLQGDDQYQQKLVLGIGAPLPRFASLPIRTRWTFEAATVIVKHGGGLPTDWIGFSEGRDFVDLINFGMFLTFEYTSADH
jgi:hypothetical protein